jgi:hypothetical protein
VQTLRIGDHEVHVLRQHLHRCRPTLVGDLCGAMSAVRRHFRIDEVLR